MLEWSGAVVSVAVRRGELILGPADPSTLRLRIRISRSATRTIISKRVKDQKREEVNNWSIVRLREIPFSILLLYSLLFSFASHSSFRRCDRDVKIGSSTILLLLLLPFSICIIYGDIIVE